MHAEEERTVAYSNHVAPPDPVSVSGRGGRARYNKKDCFAALAMTEAELIEKLRMSCLLGQAQHARDDRIPAVSARVLASRLIN